MTDYPRPKGKPMLPRVAELKAEKVQLLCQLGPLEARLIMVEAEIEYLEGMSHVLETMPPPDRPI